MYSSSNSCLYLQGIPEREPVLKSSRDECGAGESQYFPRTVLVARAARVKTSLVYCHLFLDMENLKEVKETGHREKKISARVVNLNLFFPLFA